MAKRRKKPGTIGPPMPSPHEQRKWAAESMARTMMATSPKHKKMENAIMDAVMAAGEKAMKKKM